ncbi:helix-turn-helix transcriptional regulator [Haliangium sp.]|uniref:helix-turn-helix transcriptional regulator n=1 Tax=Haliangium sp. TaxID=2663208 RepID=UPI003D14F2D4
MLSAPARLLRLLSLLQVRGAWTGTELAERLGVTARTLRRDVDRLRSLGYPITGTSGVAGGYALEAGASLPPLSFEDDEALAVSLALRFAASGLASGLEEAALRALVKLERVLPSRLRHRANALRSSIVSLARAEVGVSPTLLAALASASNEHQTVAFDYTDRAGRAGQRQVEPAGLVHSGRRWYLVGYDTDRDGWRTFRVDRITGELTGGVHFSPRVLPDDGDLRTFASRSISAAPYPAQARIILHAPIETMVERIPAPYGVLKRLDDARCILTVGAPSLAAMTPWIASIGVDFEVIEPSAFVDHLRELRARIDRALAASARPPAAPPGDD